MDYGDDVPIRRVSGAALVRAIREKKPVNEGVRLAEATMTGIMGRMSTYTGRALECNGR
jgi:hypothetical protein